MAVLVTGGTKGFPIASDFADSAAQSMHAGTTKIIKVIIAKRGRALGRKTMMSRAGTDELRKLLDERHSCRGFLSQPVLRETIEEILRIAQRTASWCNAQPWEVILLSGEATNRFRTALLEHVSSSPHSTPDYPWPREYVGAALARRRECGFQLYDAVSIAKGDRVASAKQALENFRFFGAPHVAMITNDEALGLYGAVDCGAYVSSFMLAAESFGVATIAQASLVTYGAFVREYFEIPDDRRLVCGISFGYEDRDHPANHFRTRRAPLSEVVTWIDGPTH